MINQLKQTRAITLIALIITIIVMLILAGAVINMTLGNDGIIAKAQGAVDTYKNAQEKEEIELAKVSNVVDSIVEGRGSQINGKIYKLGEYQSVTVEAGDAFHNSAKTANTIQINVAEKFANYKSLTINNFFAIDDCSWGTNQMNKDYVSYYNFNTNIISYDNDSGILTITKPFGSRDSASNTLDEVFTGKTTIYIMYNIEIENL